MSKCGCTPVPSLFFDAETGTVWAINEPNDKRVWYPLDGETSAPGELSYDEASGDVRAGSRWFVRDTSARFQGVVNAS